ncbi:MAG: ribose-phosphate diphosphokinase [Brevinemataceae bacterium]
MFKNQDLKIISGRSNTELAKNIASYMGIQLTECLITEFADEEIFVRIENDVRGKDVFLIQSTSNPGYKNIFELLVITDALKRASANEITALIPYYGYARQERKAESRVPITAKLVANLLTKAGITRIITMDLHAAQIQGFFDIPVDHLFATPLFYNYSKNTLKVDSDWIVVSPDVGGLERAHNLAKLFNAGIAVFDKRREQKNQAEILNLIGEVKGKNTILLDDMIDTAGTICQAADRLKKLGAISVHIMATHGVFSKNAPQKLHDCLADSIIITDTIHISDNIKNTIGHKLYIISSAELFGEVIERIYSNRSLSSLFFQSKKV